jgi:hypothetical protein
MPITLRACTTSQGLRVRYGDVRAWANVYSERGKAMTKTAVNDLRPCWRCDGITFWRARDGVVHCATCEPARAVWLIRDRLRATTTDNTQLGRAQRIILKQFDGRGSVGAQVVVDAAVKAGISVATLTRARETLRIRSERRHSGWMWVRPPQ